MTETWATLGLVQTVACLTQGQEVLGFLVGSSALVSPVVSLVGLWAAEQGPPWVPNR